MKLTFKPIALACALAFSAGAVYAGDNDLAVTTQNGSGNRAKLEQISSNDSRITVVQQGTENIAGRPLGDPTGILQMDSTRVSADVGQNGNANNLTIEQRSSMDSTASLQQQGDLNNAKIYQLRNTGTFAIISQNGGRNNATITQLDLSRFATDGDTGMRINQTGNDNQANAEQRGVGASGIITQNGGSNIANTNQTGINDLGIEQVGLGNNASITQISSATSGANQNLAYVTQYGNANVATAFQSGDGNRVKIIQR